MGMVSWFVVFYALQVGWGIIKKALDIDSFLSLGIRSLLLQK